MIMIYFVLKNLSLSYKIIYINLHNVNIKIENNKLVRVFDNDLNVVDECLQEVLSEKSSDKMKNIVNTIQEEQNEIIRNTKNKNYTYNY